MVVMQVRDQDGVDRPHRFRARLVDDSLQQRDATAQPRVRREPQRMLELLLSAREGA